MSNVTRVSSKEYTAVLMQGSGTFCVEAVFQTACPRQGARVLLMINGAYGKRMKTICDRLGIAADCCEFREDEMVDPLKVEEQLRAGGGDYCLAAAVHCETSSGVVNPVGELGRLVAERLPGALYLVDAMSSLGAVPLDAAAARADFVVSSANKCLQGVPGFSFVLARRGPLRRCEGNSRSLSLDLAQQAEGLDALGQFRFTPPTHALLAFRQALREFQLEGGVPARARRYRENWRILQEGMSAMGFRKLLSGKGEGYIISTYHFPRHRNFSFDHFYASLSEMGQVIYPGKVTQADCFRIGNIGDLHPQDMAHLLRCIEEVLARMAVPVPVP
ncbi:2-aminoethylphosphonate--pyruvate transaminase-like isoform X2 [Bacillus rossius redtenbacheri]|uniref:2-aminoethylphosphonate--pyruvate transaminase-like isoform X2 n=1 Tax=Bacillus rossius redtenbacheri TaxID=93214 RepID=UPI002FDD5E5B